MGSRTKFFGTVLAMLAVNSIYIQLQQLSMTLQLDPVDPVPSEQSSPEPQSTSERLGPLRRIAQVFQVLRFVDANLVGILQQESTPPLEP